MARPDGWRDDELLALLQQLRENMTEYIYSTDEAFARSIQRAFRDKSARSIMEAVRDLMDGLSFAMKTRKFTNEAILADENCVYPHEHLYETMSTQPENRQGGVWDPDELRSALRKMETYRHFFDENPELFFARVQIWSKNVPDVRTKFYLWREIYLDASESIRASEKLHTDGERKRVEYLHKIFEDVPPAPSPVPPTPSPMSPAPSAKGAIRTFTPITVTASTGKPPKVRMWSPDELEVFVQLLVEVTMDLQTKGTSLLVQDLAVRLNRSEMSLLGKVQDIRARYEKRTASQRAAEIPSVIYDKTSVAHKIFTADWSDTEDPYSLAIFALKDIQNRALRKLKARKARVVRPPPLQMEMRHRSSSASSTLASPGGTTATAATTTPKTTDAAQHPKPQIHPVTKSASSTTNSTTTASTNSKPPRVPTASKTPTLTYSEFVRDCAAMIKWTESQTLELCLTMRTALPEYNKAPRRVFYEQVADALGGGPDSGVVYFSGERILRLCERRYGSLDCFAAAVEGNGGLPDTPPAVRSSIVTETPLSHDTTTTPVREPPSVDSPAPATNVSPPVDSCTGPPAKTTLQDAARAFGKSNETAKQIYEQKGDATCVVGTPTERTESSPSVQYYSPEHYEYEYDPAEGGDVEDTPREEELDNNDDDDGVHETTGKGESEVDVNDNDNDETQSVGMASDVSSDYGHDARVAIHSTRHTHKRYHRDATPGKVHVSSRKTLVVEHAPQPCYCDDCGRHVRQRQGRGHASKETTVASIHRKRTRSEMYTASGRWVEDHHAVHAIAHRRHVQYGGRRDEMQLVADPDEEMTEQEVAEMDGMWAAMLAPIEKGIGELEAKRQEQHERAMDRERQERERHWKKDLRQLVRDEWNALAGAKEMAAPAAARVTTSTRPPQHGL